MHVLERKKFPSEKIIPGGSDTLIGNHFLQKYACINAFFKVIMCFKVNMCFRAFFPFFWGDVGGRVNCLAEKCK